MNNYYKPRLKFKILIIAFLLLFLFSFLLFPAVYGDSELTYLLIDPPAYVAKENAEIYTINVNISNVKNLHEAYFTLTYNTSFLDVITVSQGSFFPRSQSHFDFKVDSLSGLIEVNLSLTNSLISLDGEGSLAEIAFKVIQNSTSCAYSTLNFQKILLLDSELAPIAHQSVGAIVFWKSIYDPYMEGRSLDVYTQKAGEGPNKPGGVFFVFEVIHLFSEVKYNNWSVAQALVAFQVINPYDETVFVRTSITNQAGLANVSFRIPPIASSVGVWTAVSTVSLAEKVVWDIVVFEVHPPLVGGDVQTIDYKTTKYDRTDKTTFYSVAILTITVFYTLIRRKRKIGALQNQSKVKRKLLLSRAFIRDKHDI